MKKYLDFNLLMKSIKEIKVFDFLLILVVLLLCFDKLTMRYLIMTTVIAGLIKGNYTLFKNKNSLYKLLSTLLWIIPFLQLLILDSFIEHWSKLETKLTLFIIPIIILITFTNKPLINKLVKYFVYGCLLSIIFCITNVCFKFFVLKSVNNISYNNLSIFHHPSYYAMYINFSIGILYLRLLYPLKKYNYSLIILFMIFTSSCFIVLLASRTGWITNLLIHLLFVIFHLINKSLKKTHVLFGLSIVLCFILMNKIPSVKIRSNEVINSSTVLTEKKQIKYTSSTNTRKLAWETSFELINQNLLFGIGTGNSTKILNQTYERKGYKSLKNKSINCHNQFIQFQLDHGLIGSICLLFFTLIMLIFSLVEKDFLYALFLTIIILNFMTESMLETQSGVVFFSFFNTLFFYNFIDKKFNLN